MKEEDKDKKRMPRMPNPEQRRFPRWIIYLAGILFIFTLFSPGNKIGEPINDIMFAQMIEKGGIKHVVREFRPNADGYKIHFVVENKTHEMSITKSQWDKYERLFDENGIDYSLTEPSGISRLFWTVFPILLIFMLLMLLWSSQFKKQNKMFGGLTSAPMKIFEKGDAKVTFNDVAGCDEAKAEVRQILDFLKNPEKFTKLGGKMPKGYLLVGYPGCGKTLLAKAVAGEADVPFISISGSEFVEMFVGVGAGRIRSLFDTARKKSPCIVFIDEIDALSKRGQSVVSNGHDESGQTMNQLLVELDGFQDNPGIVFMAATNQPDKVDEALLRPGRFDRQITVSKPDVRGREAILQVHMAGKTASPDINLKEVAKMTPGFTGADLANLTNEAAILASEESKEVIEQNDLEKSISRVTMGYEQKGKIISKKERDIIAYHEAGHGLVAQLLFGDVHKISIIPRGIGALGYTLQLPEEEKYLLSESEIKRLITVLLAGRGMEKRKFGETSSGASNDILRATTLARDFVCRFGMSPEIGPQNFIAESKSFLGSQLAKSREYSEDTAKQIDKIIEELIKNQEAEADNIIEYNNIIVEELVKRLLEKETLERDEIKEITKNVKNPINENPK